MAESHSKKANDDVQGVDLAPISERNCHFRLLKVGGISTAFVLTYTSLTWGNVSSLYAGGMVVALAVLSFAILACVGHDAVHGAFSRSPAGNAIALCALDLFGVNGEIWRSRHLTHHRVTNQIVHDPETSLLPWLRLNPYERVMPHHRIQAAFAPIAYCLTLLKLQFTDEPAAIRASMPKKQRRLVVRSILGKFVFFGWCFALPIWANGVGRALPFAVLGYLALGLIIGVVFQVAHNLPTTRHLVERPVGHEAWQRSQIETTTNFRASFLHSFLIGGLDRQIEHHLFPQVPHTMLAKLEVRSLMLCRRLGVDYKVERSLGHALISHLRNLHTLGAQDRHTEPSHR